jgi:2-keto-3-deoxy-galactonokinase
MAQIVGKTGSGKPVLDRALRARGSEMDPVRELPYGPAASERPLIEAGHMSAPDAAPDILKNLLAPTGASTHVQILSHIFSSDVDFGFDLFGLIQRLHVHVALG